MISPWSTTLSRCSCSLGYGTSSSYLPPKTYPPSVASSAMVVTTACTSPMQSSPAPRGWRKPSSSARTSSATTPYALYSATISSTACPSRRPCVRLSRTPRSAMRLPSSATGSATLSATAWQSSLPTAAASLSRRSPKSPRATMLSWGCTSTRTPSSRSPRAYVPRHVASWRSRV